MRTQEKLLLKGNRALRFLLPALLGLVLLCICGCPQLREWRDQQIETSHSLASNQGAVTLPSPPISLPGEIESSVPYDAEFTVLTYQKSHNNHSCRILSSKGLENTVQWVLAGMQSKGYTLDDNPSRVLEGVEFQNESAKYRTILVKVEQNSAAQVLITYELTEY